MPCYCPDCFNYPAGFFDPANHKPQVKETKPMKLVEVTPTYTLREIFLVIAREPTGVVYNPVRLIGYWGVFKFWLTMVFQPFVMRERLVESYKDAVHSRLLNAEAEKLFIERECRMEEIKANVVERLRKQNQEINAGTTSAATDGAVDEVVEPTHGAAVWRAPVPGDAYRSGG